MAQTQRNLEVWDGLREHIEEAVRQLAPGKHTLRVVRGIPDLGVPRYPPSIRVLSNPVELVVVPRAVNLFSRPIRAFYRTG